MRWRPKIGRCSWHRFNVPAICGWCGKPIEKGQAKSTMLWMRGSNESCTTRRHQECDIRATLEDANGLGPPSDAEIAEHKRRKEARDV